MIIFVKFASFLVISLLKHFLSPDKSDAKNNIVEYFLRKSCLVYFPPALEVSAHVMQVTPFCFKFKFSMEKINQYKQRNISNCVVQFQLLRIIREKNRIHYKLNQKINYKDSVLSPSRLKLLGDGKQNEKIIFSKFSLSFCIFNFTNLLY